MKQTVIVTDKIILPDGHINIKELFTLRYCKGLEYSLIMYFLLIPRIDFDEMKLRKQYSKKATPLIEKGIARLLELGFIRLEKEI